MRFHYDKKEDALYLRFNENPYSESEEMREGIIFDYDKNGKIIGIEILDASQKFSRQFQSEFRSRKLPLTLTLEPKTKVAV